ncbi:glycoside hydrolase family 6 protein [Streptomyces sp. CRN 30]|uniref:glycoside hydrolase family 6 protein n=1 Tax=Streptomyces sp. CRN 30 TaxID=3075613 RepID=UPI002A7F01DD|nr:glycoside hydrolase family 6 protein [Streptomyces sp. CRN 30]
MVAAAAAVTAVGAVTGLLAVSDDGRRDEARPVITRSAAPEPLPAVPSVSPATITPTPSRAPTPTPSPVPARTKRPPVPSPTVRERAERAVPATVTGRLYRHPGSQVLDWVAAHPDDPRQAVIDSRIAAHPAAVWFTDPSPATITARVAAVTSGAAAQGRVPVVVAYAVRDRDCGGASRGGASGPEEYDAWIDAFAAGLGGGEVVVILEPDAIALADCLDADGRADRFASLARAGRVLKAANPRARVYHDAGHSAWHPPARQAALLRQAGAASAASSDGVFSNVSNFNGTDAEVAYVRRVLDALGGPADLGAVIDTSRNGNGAPGGGEWCDPAGRTLGRPPTLTTGQARVDAYLWVKLPGESDGCRGAAGTFTPGYAYDLAR